jgi:hypothetical protein
MTTFALLAWIAWNLSLNKRQVHFSARPATAPAATNESEPDPFPSMRVAVVIGLVLLA